MNDKGLVLEGGGMRGVYTAGVLECFLERGLFFPYVIGVSAGACNAASYLSRQLGRNRKVTIGYVGDSRYLSWRNLLREKSLFGMNFIFDEIPRRLEPFDFEAFAKAPERFVVGTTDAVTGEPVYYEKNGDADMLAVIRASSSLPFVAPPIEIDGRVLFDGGVSDPIPLRKAVSDGFVRSVVVLTKPEGYRKSPSRMGRRAARMVYPGYPGLADAMSARAHRYNETLEEIERRSESDDLFLLRPSVDLKVGRTDRNPERLTALYELGYRDASAKWDALQEWLVR